jgi:hypothetical protein
MPKSFFPGMVGTMRRFLCFRLPRPMERVMAQQLQRPQSGYPDTAWLSMLVGTMEKLASPDYRELPCDKDTLIEVTAHLARPIGHLGYPMSRFSLQN